MFFFAISLFSTGKVNAAHFDGITLGISESLGTYSTGIWQHVAGVFYTHGSRSVFFDGIERNTTTPFVFTSPSLDTTRIGARVDGSLYHDGDIAELAVWNIGLLAEEIAILSANYSPLLLTGRLGNLVGYQDLISALNRPGIGPNFTANGTIISTHPPMIYPTGGIGQRRRLVPMESLDTK